MADAQDPTPPIDPKTSSSVATLEMARAAAEAGARRAKEGARVAEAMANKTAETGQAAAKANSQIFNSQIETAQKAMQSSLEAGMRSLEEMTQTCTRAFGVASPNPDLAAQSAHSLQAVSQVSTALAKGAQDCSRAWLELTQQAMRTNLESFSRLASCRSMQEVMAVQSNLLRDNLQQAMESTEAITRMSSNAIREAGRAIQPPAH